jgi:polyribonucleotide nucleotidyltransferase
MIRSITEQSGAKIDIDDDGTITIAAVDPESARKALDLIKSIVAEPEIGAVYTGTVKKVAVFGAFVEIMPGKEGMVHISDLDHSRVNRVEDVVNVGDQVTVKVISIDPAGKVKLSRKATLPGGPPSSGPSRPGGFRKHPSSGDRR